MHAPAAFRPLFLLLGFVSLLPSIACAQDWMPQNGHVSVDLNCVDFYDTQAGWIAGDGGVILQTSDGGNSWGQQVTHTTRNLRAVSFRTREFGLAAGDGGVILRTTTAGASWSVVHTDTTEAWNGLQTVNSGFACAVGTDAAGRARAAVTTNGGLSWTAQSFWIDGHAGGLTDIGFSAAGEGFATAWMPGGGGAIVKTSNAGTNWSTIMTVPQALYSIDFPEVNIGFICGASGSVYRTSDAGASWYAFPAGGPDAYGVSFPDGLHGWVAGSAGSVRYTGDGGMSWAVQDPGVEVALRSVSFVDRLLGWVVGDGGLILRTTDGGGAAEVLSGSRAVAAPGPNPFRTFTDIRYTLGEAAFVRIEVLDPTGRLVAWTDRGAEISGTHAWRWNGMTETGRAAPAGTYFCRVLTGEGEPLIQRIVRIAD